MTIQDLQIKMEEQFRKHILQSAYMKNELYLDVISSGIKEICIWLGSEFGCTLISLFAMDERENK